MQHGRASFYYLKSTVVWNEKAEITVTPDNFKKPLALLPNELLIVPLFLPGDQIFSAMHPTSLVVASLPGLSSCSFDHLQYTCSWLPSSVFCKWLKTGQWLRSNQIAEQIITTYWHPVNVIVSVVLQQRSKKSLRSSQNECDLSTDLKPGNRCDFSYLSL